MFIMTFGIGYVTAQPGGKTDDSTKSEIEGHFKEGVSYFVSSEWDQAVEKFQKVIELDPENIFGKTAESHNNIGLIYWEEGLLDDAAVEFKAAVRINPELSVSRPR